MYIVSIQNGSNVAEIQNEHYKLFSGKVVQGINGIDSFTFSILPDNPAFGALNDFTTLVSVYNLARQRYEFQGRVLYTSPQMSDEGLLTQEAVCESYLGFLCDSQQEYTSNWNWTAVGLLLHFIDAHNAQVEDYKHFQVGEVDVIDMSDKLNGIEVQRGNTWESIKKYLIDELGGEIRFRQEDGVNYIDYLKQQGEVKSTEIALSKNMKSIVKEKNPSAFITRLIPLGAKIEDDEGNETEQRVDITSVNHGLNYIDDDEAIAVYGLHVGCVEFDGVTDPEDENYNRDEDVSKPSVVLRKGEEWLEANNKVSIKYSITALDLSLIGLDADDFEVFNTYPLKNSLLGINDTGRLHKKTIDVCDDTKTSIEIGESFKTLSELQREQMVSLGALNYNVANIIRNYVPNQRLVSVTRELTSIIEQTENRITLEVGGKFASKDDLKGYSTTAEMNTAIEQKVTESEASITQKVAGTYATKNDLTGYYTKSQANAAILTAVNLSEATIRSEVEGTYATKDDLEGYSTTSEVSAAIEQKVSEAAASIDSNVSRTYVTRNAISNYYTKSQTDASIKQTVDDSGASILQTVSGTYATKDEFGEFVETAEASLELKVGRDENDQVVSMLNASAKQINLTSDRLRISSTYFTLNADGSASASKLDMQGGTITLTDNSDKWVELGIGGGLRVLDTTTFNGYCACAQYSANVLRFGRSISFGGNITNTNYFVYEAYNGSPYVNIYGSWNGNSSGSISSDATLKHDIELLDSRYDCFFNSIIPRRFKYNDGTSGRYHFGYVTQEIQAALAGAGIPETEFAAICTYNRGTDKEFSALRYSEFIALNTWQIQKLKDRVEELEERLARYEQ